MNGYKKIELYEEAQKFETLEDYREAFNLYLASAKQGYAKAQLAVAKFYLGDGVYKGIVKADKEKAVDFLNQAEAGGNAEAKYRLALILLERKNSKDTARALELLQDASDRQYFLATFELAKCHYYGIGFKQSYLKTLELFEKVIYGKGAMSQIEFCCSMRKILAEIKNLEGEQKKKIGLSGDYLCLFNDLCNDLSVDD